MKSISDSYTVSTLMKMPETKEILLKHLGSLGIDEKQLSSVHATLKEMRDTNMGGGIPYNTIMALMKDLDSCDLQPSKDAMDLANLIYDIYQDKKKMGHPRNDTP